MKQRPISNRDYKIKNRETGLWELVKATPTPVAEFKVYASRTQYKRKGYAKMNLPQGL